MQSVVRTGDRREGSALAAMLAVAVLLSGIIYSTTLVSSVEVRDARRGLDRVRALALAEGGIERAVAVLAGAMSKTASFDPLYGVRALFDNGSGGFQAYTPFSDFAITDDGREVGRITVTMTALARDDGLDVTIRSTGFAGTAPAAPRRTVESVVRVETEPAKVFDNSYFINNWGWFYGNTIYCNGNARSNGQFDAGGYAPTITGQPTYDKLVWNGGDADLQGYRDDNGDGLQDGNDGGVFSGWDIVNVANVQGNGGKAANQHDFEERVPMPNLSDLTQYETLAKSEGGSIKIGGNLVSNAVYGDEPGERQNLYLIGTPSEPIEIDGTVVVRQNVIIAGVVKGQGAIYSGGNIYVPNNLTYADPPTTARPAGNTEAETEQWLETNKDKDLLGLFARENVVVGDHTNSTWRSYVGWWLGHPANASKEDAGEDQIPNTAAGKDGIPGTADDDVLEGDGQFTTQKYTQQDADLGLIPPGKSVNDPIPGTGEDIDGDGVFDDTIGLAQLDLPGPVNSATWGGNVPPGGNVNYSSIASLAIDRLDGVFYTNHAFAWLTVPSTPINVNGAIVSRNESIIYGGPGIHMNYDCRLLGGNSGMASGFLPRTPAPIRTLSWRILDEHAAQGGVN